MVSAWQTSTATMAMNVMVEQSQPRDRGRPITKGHSRAEGQCDNGQIAGPIPVRATAAVERGEPADDGDQPGGGVPEEPADQHRHRHTDAGPQRELSIVPVPRLITRKRRIAVSTGDDIGAHAGAHSSHTGDMPELPEVEALADHLRRHALGKVVNRVDISALSVLKTFDPPVTALHGNEVTGAARWGKYLGLQVGELHLITHLSRAGWLRWSDKLAPTPLKPGKGPIALRVHLAESQGLRS